MTYYVYLLARKPFGALSVGVMSDPVKHVFEHKNKAVPGFIARYGVDRLVWYEAYDSVEAAIQREKRIKEWRREWKFNPIERDNLHWDDFYDKLPI